MDQEIKRYLGEKFHDSEASHKQAQEEIMQTLKRRKQTLLRIFSVYAVIMLIMLVLLMVYFFHTK